MSDQDAAAVSTESVRTGAEGRRRLTVLRRLEELRGVAKLKADAEARWQAAKGHMKEAVEISQREVQTLHAEYSDLERRAVEAAAEIKQLEAELASLV